jgi:hypothetical protein
MCYEGPTFLPVYQVTQSGATLPQALSLANLLHVPTNSLVVTNGLVSYIDPSNWMAVPYITVTASNNPAISNLIAETINPIPTNPITIRAFDFATISNLSVFDTNVALNSFSNALAASGLAPQLGTLASGHDYFYAFATNEDQSVTTVFKPLDTLVACGFQLPGASNSYPLIGAGAQAQVDYGPTGNVTRLLYAARQLSAGPSVQIISPMDASNRVAGFFPSNTPINLQLVYLAPSLLPPTPLCPTCSPPTWSPSNIIPYYAFSGTIASNAPNGPTTTIYSRPRLIPATDDTNYVPSFSLSVTQAGSNILANVSVSGGSPPYVYHWQGSATTVATNSSASISYTPITRIQPPPLSIAPYAPDPGPGPTDCLQYVSWPYPSTGFILESSPSITSPNWTQVSVPVMTNAYSSGFNLVTIEGCTNAGTFLRLRLASQTVPATESLSVMVTDANGVSIYSNRTFTVQAVPISVLASVPDPSYGIEDPYNLEPTFGFASEMHFVGGGSPVYTHSFLNAQPGDWISQSAPAMANPPLPPGITPVPLNAAINSSGVNIVNFLYYESYQSTPTSISFQWPGIIGLASTWNELSIKSESPYSGDFNYWVNLLGQGSFNVDYHPLGLADSWGGGTLKCIVFDSPNVLQWDPTQPASFPPAPANNPIMRACLKNHAHRFKPIYGASGRSC